MNKRLVPILVGVLFFTSCAKDISDKEIDEMSLIELNEYNSYLKQEKEEVEDYYQQLLDISDGKSYDEIVEMFNYVNNEVVKSNVMITSESKSFFSGSTISSGSGIIIGEDRNYYYALTNNHVIYSLGRRTSYYVYDYLNNEYSATLLFSEDSYDMALLRFTKAGNLRVMELASSDVKEKDNVIVIGQPLEQRNAISFGDVLGYGKVNCPTCKDSGSDINYDCVFYDAVTNNGNSGGMIINYDYKLVGVVTFGMSDDKGNYMYGAGSPVSKVKEFLLKNGIGIGGSNE